MELKSKPGSHIKKKHLNEIAKIMKKRGGVTAQTLLDEARNKSNPLHDYFDWDDKIAAEKWRLSRAGDLLRKVVIEVEIDNEPVLIRAFHAIQVDDEETKVYTPLRTVLSDKEKLQQVIDYALDEMEGWRERYQQYQQLRPIIRSYEKVKRRLKKKPKK